MTSPAPRRDPASSSDGPRSGGVVFSERLLPGVGGWIGIVVFALVLGIAVTVVNLATAVITAVLALVIGVALAWWSSPVIAVRDGELVAGSAHIPLDQLGEVTVLDREGIHVAMGPQWDPRAFACLRTWAGGGVRVDVVDPADPTPYWIVSSRRARELATVLTAQG